MSDNLKSKTVLWIDNGLFHGFARRVAPAFKKNYYWTPWAESFATQRHTRLGAGFPELERVNYAQDVEGKVDLFVFLDLFHADWARRLRRDGRRVWAAFDTEDVELRRLDFRKWCASSGFPLTEAETAVGADELRAKLEGYDRAFVKLADGYNRGDMETWEWKGEHLSSLTLEERMADLGAFKDATVFLIERKMKDVIELGEDGLNVWGQWPDHIMQGMEVKGLGTVGIVKPYEKLPLCLRDFNAKLAPVFAGEKASTFFCMEGLLAQAPPQLKPSRPIYYPMDPCLRLGSPSNELLQELFSGWAETLWYGAEGKMLSPKPVAKYGIVTMIYNENSGRQWQPLYYPPAVDQWVKLRNPYAIGQRRYAVPQGSPTNLAGVVGVGNTLLEAAAAMGKHARAIEGNQIEIATDSLLKMLDIIKKSNAWGATFTTDPLPGVEELKRAIG